MLYRDILPFTCTNSTLFNRGLSVLNKELIDWLIDLIDGLIDWLIDSQLKATDSDIYVVLLCSL